MDSSYVVSIGRRVLMHNRGIPLEGIGLRFTCILSGGITDPKMTRWKEVRKRTQESCDQVVEWVGQAVMGETLYENKS